MVSRQQGNCSAAGGESSLAPPPPPRRHPYGPAGVKRLCWSSKEDLLLNARGFSGNNFPSS